MKYFSLVLTLALGVPSICGFTPFKKHYKLDEELKDGFEVIYKYEEESVYTGETFKNSNGEKFDLHFRKTSDQDDPNKMVVQMTNSPNGSEKLLLPLVLDKDRKIFVTAEDTEESVQMKIDAIMTISDMHKQTSRMLHEINFTDTSASFTKDQEIMSFGDCNVQFSIQEDEKHVTIDINFKREQCRDIPEEPEVHLEEGRNGLPTLESMAKLMAKKIRWTVKLWKNFDQELEKYGANDVDGGTEFKLKLVYDTTTRFFVSMRSEMNGKVASDKNVNFSKKKSIFIDNSRKILKVIDESKNTVLYKIDLQNEQVEKVKPRFQHNF